MKVENFKIKKGSFRLDIKDIDFSNKGIYLLKGKNGTGKTTFIETILKRSNLVNIKNKERNISYFSQQLYKYSITAREYLGDENKEIIQKYCELFEIDYLHKNITHISGGEFVKLAIIRCIAKDSPILIFDEPTNNLDNTATDIVNMILNELGQNKTVIILTHDQRLKLDYHTIYQFEHGQIAKIVSNHNDAQAEIKNNEKEKKYPVFRAILFSKFNLLMSSFIFCVIALICLWGSNYIKSNVPLSDILPHNDYIELLYIAEPCASYIQAVVSDKEYKEKYQNANKHLHTNELLELSNKSFIEKIYVIDNSYINLLNGEAEELKLFSIPNIITDSPNNQRSYPGTKGFLISGRLPKDNKFEMVSSYDQMLKFFNYRGDVNDIIGSKVKIENTEYTVVGLTNLSITTISYQNNAAKQYGVIEVSHNKGLELENILTRMVEQGYDSSSIFFRNVFIQYKEGKEKEMMSFLQEYAPSYQYNSNYVNDTLTLYHYKKISPKMFFISLFISLIFGLMIIIIGKKSFVLVDDYIKDMDNLNYRPQKNQSCLYITLLVDYLTILPFVMLYTYFTLHAEVGLKLMLPFLSTSMFIFGLSIFILRKRVVKMNG